MRSFLRAYLITAIGVVSGLIQIIVVIIPSWGATPPAWQPTLAAVSILGLYFFIAHVASRARWERKTRYADAFSLINGGFQEIHYLARVSEPSIATMKEGFRAMCDTIAQVFTEVTGHKCSACIKILNTTPDGQSLGYETLCRDRGVSARRKSMDERAQAMNLYHPIERNTAFSEASKNGWFLCNRLPTMQNYSNTSFELIDGEKHYAGLNVFRAIYRWPLPYRSALVVPIQPAKGVDPSLNGETIGFLCVDSMEMGIFREGFDVPIMTGIADGIYNNLVRLKKMMVKTQGVRGVTEHPASNP